MHGVRLFFLLLLLNALQSLSAQTAYPDLIVSQNSDTLRCAFRRINESTIFFWMLGPAGKPVAKEMWKKDASLFVKHFYARREAGYAGTVQVQPERYYRPPGKTMGRFRLGLEGGYGRWLSPVNDRTIGYFNYLGVPFARQRNGLSGSLYAGYQVTRWLEANARIDGFRGRGTTQNTFNQRLKVNSYGAEAIFKRPLSGREGNCLFGTLGLFYSRIWETNTQDFFSGKVKTWRTAQSRVLPQVGLGIRLRVTKSMFFQAAVRGSTGNTETDWGKLGLTRIWATSGLGFSF